MGRIGIDVSLSNPSVIYAIVQTASAPRGGGDDEEGDAPRPGAGRRAAPRRRRLSFRRSRRDLDVGQPGERSSGVLRSLRVDPTNENRVSMLDQNVSLSLDGGRTFQTLRINATYHHAM